MIDADTFLNDTELESGISNIREALERPFPAHAILQRDGRGGRKYDYLQAQTVIRRLNEATNNNWTFRVTRLEWHPEKPFSFRERNNTREETVLIAASGELEIPGFGTRSGIGVQIVGERDGEDMVKGAVSDCIKNCARLFGVGLDLYGPDYESGEVAEPRQQYAATSNNSYGNNSYSGSPNSGNGSSQGANLITEKQEKFVYSLAKNAGMEKEDIDMLAAEKYGVTVHNLQRRDASVFIEEIKQMPGASAF